jgi:integrase
LTKAMAERDSGLPFDAGKLKLGEYLKRWLNDSVRGSVKPITSESYERLVRVHIAPALGRLQLKSLSPAHLQGFYRERLDKGLSPRTVQYLHVLLHKALKQALKLGVSPANRYKIEVARPGFEPGTP